MANWLTRNWLTAAAVLAIVGAVSGWMRSAHHRGLAEAAAAEAERVTLMLAAQSDSTDAARALAADAERRALAQRAAHDSVLARLNARLADLGAANARLAAEAEAELDAHDGWLSRETHDRLVASLERTLLTTDSLRMEAEALAAAERDRGDALAVVVGELSAQVELFVARDSVRVREIESLRRAVDAGGLLPDMGVLTDPVLIVGGALVGYLLRGG